MNPPGESAMLLQTFCNLSCKRLRRGGKQSRGKTCEELNKLEEEKETNIVDEGKRGVKTLWASATTGKTNPKQQKQRKNNNQKQQNPPTATKTHNCDHNHSLNPSTSVTTTTTTNHNPQTTKKQLRKSEGLIF